MSITYIKRKSYGSDEVLICRTEVPFQQADFANKLMEHLAILAGTPDGCDESGRQKLRLMTPDEVVDRAISIADIAWTRYRARGWLLDLPIPEVRKDQP